MISLNDLFSSDTMAGEAGQQAPKILLGAADIANAFLSKEAAQNKLMMEDLQLKKELEEGPINTLLTKAKAIQDLNIADPTPNSDDIKAALFEAFPDGPPKNEKGEIELPQQDYANLENLAKKKAQSRLGLAPYDINNPTEFIRTRAKEGMIRPEYEVKKEIADLTAQARALENEKKFERELQKILQAQGFNLKTLGITLQAQDERHEKTLKNQAELTGQRLAAQFGMLDQRQRQQDKLLNEKRADQALKAMGSAKQNPVLTKEQRAKAVTTDYQQVLQFGNAEQQLSAWENHKDVLIPAGWEPPGLGGPLKPAAPLAPKPKAGGKGSGALSPKALKWIKENPNHPKAKAALEKLRAEGKL